MTFVIIPLGFPIGPQYRIEPPPDPEPERYDLHLADDLVHLSRPEFVAYQLAGADEERHARCEFDRTALERDLSAVGDLAAEPANLVQALMDRGVLLEFDPQGPLEKVFSGVQLFPTGQGLGGVPEQPNRHYIGVCGAPRMSLSTTPLTLWAFSFLYENLWEACVDFANDVAVGAADGKEHAASEVARRLAEGIPLMIATRCAFLDPLVGK